MSQPNLQLAKKLNIAATIVSAVVMLLVIFMRRIHFDTSIDFSSELKQFLRHSK